MPRLPIPGQDEGRWGEILNDFLRTSLHEDGTVKGVLSVANVRDFGATGDGSKNDTEAITQAIQTGAHVYIPAGEYRYDQLVFGNSYQQITCAPDAVLKPLQSSSLITFTWSRAEDGSVLGRNQVIRNLKVVSDIPVDTLIKVNAPGCRFEGIEIYGPNAKIGLYLTDFTKCVFMGGEIKGAGAFNAETTTGIHISNAYEIIAYGLTIHHWDIGIRYSGSFNQDMFFYGGDIENNGDYGVYVAPIEGGSDSESQVPAKISNLNFISCHFEGNPTHIHVAEKGVIGTGLITGCPFASSVVTTTRVIQADGPLYGVVLMANFLFGNLNTDNLFIWEVNAQIVGCVDLFNDWRDMVDAYVFSIELDLVTELDQGGRVSKNLIDKFGESKITISPEFMIIVEEAGQRWTITYNDVSRTFRIERENQMLNVYVEQRVSIGSYANHLVRLLTGFNVLEVHGRLSHQGDRLGFYGVEPANQATGIEPFADPATATTQEVAQRYNQLVAALKNVGLLG